LTKKKKALSLVVIEGAVEESAVNSAKGWVEAVMKAVYDGKLGSSFCADFKSKFFQMLV
jgi:hypothetical protein